MKVRSCFFWALVLLAILNGCNGDSNSSSTAGTVSVLVTDARPSLPPGTEQVLIRFDEVRVHQSGGEWTSLELAQSPYTIDLLQFTEGDTVELVPPVSLAAGKYTQIRIGVDEGSIVTGEGTFALYIPSQYLKTDKVFEFDVAAGGAVSLTVDFDLSQSIVSSGNGYQLKPVLHVCQTQEAATIQGYIAPETFLGFVAIITVTSEGTAYTSVTVTRESSESPTEFLIYWLVPDQEYTVEIEVNGGAVYDETIEAEDLESGEVFLLNNGSPI